MTLAERKRVVIIAMSAYNINKDFTIDDWFNARKIVKLDKLCRNFIKEGKW